MKMIPFFSLARQNELIGKEIKNKISEIIDSGVYVGGPVVEEFEDRWAEFNGHKHCVFCSSGTSALEIAIRCLDLDADAYIYTSSNSFLASSSCISANNKQPFFLDTDFTCNFDISELEKYLKQNLDGSYKDGVIGVHLYGNSLDLIRLKQICHDRKVPFILDLAQAHGCEYRGKPVASYSYIACFSHYVTKTFGAFGEAGSIVTSNDEYYKECVSLRNHGRDSDGYSHQYLSGNHRGDAIQAAVLLVKLKYLNELVEQRVELSSIYTRYLLGSKNIKLLDITLNSKWVPYVFPVFVKNRDRVKKELYKAGVECGIHYPTIIPLQSCYRNLGFATEDFPNAYQQSQETLSLPFWPEMTKEEAEIVCEKLIDTVQKVN